MMMLAARSRDPDRERSTRITDRYNARNLEIFREAMKRAGKDPEEIDRLADELEERMKPRRP